MAAQKCRNIQQIVFGRRGLQAFFRIQPTQRRFKQGLLTTTSAAHCRFRGRTIRHRRFRLRRRSLRLRLCLTEHRNFVFSATGYTLEQAQPLRLGGNFSTVHQRSFSHWIDTGFFLCNIRSRCGWNISILIEHTRHSRRSRLHPHGLHYRCCSGNFGFKFSLNFDVRHIGIIMNSVFVFNAFINSDIKTHNGLVHRVFNRARLFGRHLGDGRFKCEGLTRRNRNRLGGNGNRMYGQYGRFRTTRPLGSNTGSHDGHAHTAFH